MISKEDINKLPLFQYSGKVILVNSQETLESAFEELNKETVLGFDTETRPSFKKGVFYDISIMQFGTLDVVYIFQIAKLKSLEKFISLFSNPKIIKAGIAIRDDLIGLKKLIPFKDQGFFEITNLSTKLGITNKGLRGLAALVLGKRISKKAQISNWAREDLSKEQINYAATDAWACRQIYITLTALLDDSSD